MKMPPIQPKSERIAVSVVRSSYEEVSSAITARKSRERGLLVSTAGSTLEARVCSFNSTHVLRSGSR